MTIAFIAVPLCEHFAVARRLAGAARERMLRVEQPAEAQVAGVRQAVCEVGGDAGFELGHGRGAVARGERRTSIITADGARVTPRSAPLCSRRLS